MPKFLAKQLRKPSGKMGETVGLKMNESNLALYDFILSEMQIKANQSILEIGFGNGKLFDKVFAEAPNLSLYGIDFSETMYIQACHTNQEAIDSGKLTLNYGDCEKLPFPDQFFDKVFCINVVYFWKNPKKNLSEILRVLKPGGQFYTGIRNAETMRKMPFTQYGFKIYERPEWEELVIQSNFVLGTVSQKHEPEIEFSGVKLIPTSLCFTAIKPV